MQNFYPLGTNVLIKCDAPPSSSDAGLIIPEVALEKSKPTRGTVVKAGPDAREVKPGDRVLFPKFLSQTSDEIHVGKDKFRITREPEIIAVLEGE